MEIRVATHEDLDFMTDEGVKASSTEPAFCYRYPYYKDYPEDTYNFAKMQLRYMLETPSKFTVMVACTKSNEDPSIVKPVSHAVWLVENLQPSEQPGFQIPVTYNGMERRDANKARLKAFHAALMDGVKKYFDDSYGTKAIGLFSLATHPDYQRRGAGSMLVRWGLEKARQNEMAVTLFGSPMGTPLYEHLGFKMLGKVFAQAEGEEERISANAMAYEYRG